MNPVSRYLAKSIKESPYIFATIAFGVVGTAIVGVATPFALAREDMQYPTHKSITDKLKRGEELPVYHVIGQDQFQKVRFSVYLSHVSGCVPSLFPWCCSFSSVPFLLSFY